MLKEEALIRQQRLEKLLYELSIDLKDSTGLRKIALSLCDIYSNNFRHNYAGFFAIIVEMSSPDNKYNLEYLSTNLEELRSTVEDSYIAGDRQFNYLYPRLIKLSDHINLEIARYTYYSVSNERMSELERNLKESQGLLSRSSQELSSAKRKMSKVQSDLVAVLGIFAAIIIAFSGSISVLGNALSGMQNAPFYKTVFFVLLCGFVLFNTICILLYMVSKITDNNIMVDCEEKRCTCKNKKGKPKCKGITKIRKRLPYVFWFNLILITLMVADLALWIFYPKLECLLLSK